MTAALAEKNILVRADSGDWYSIPPQRQDEFIAINEQAIVAEVGSGEWDSAISDLNMAFGRYLK